MMSISHSTFHIQVDLRGIVGNIVQLIHSFSGEREHGLERRRDTVFERSLDEAKFKMEEEKQNEHGAQARLAERCQRTRLPSSSCLPSVTCSGLLLGIAGVSLDGLLDVADNDVFSVIDHPASFSLMNRP
jgi:hypothetical protein